jgi:HlyD family secretion protein
MRRWIIILVLLLLVAAGGYAAVQTGLVTIPGQSQATPPAATGPNGAAALGVPGQALGGSVVADARVVPVKEANLSLAASGIVDALYVAEGDIVEAGQVILRLENAQQKVAVARAQADLQRSQAGLAQALAGPREQEIASAQAALDAATTRYDRLANASLPGGIAEAEAGLASAQAGLAKVLEGSTEQELIQARADIKNAEAELQRAQSAYNRVRWQPEVGMLPESAALQRATNEYEATQARLADLESGPSQADIASASAQVRRSRATLDTLRAAMPEDLAEAEANLRASQAQLDLLLAGARSEEIAAAEAEVAAATAALQQTLVTLSEVELRAPFSGTIAELLINTGEQVSPNAPVVRLADLSRWQIETEDLTELDIVGVNQNTPVLLTFDAIPDLEMPGAVQYIRPVGQDNRGDIVYTVVIAPEQQDPRLLWNMTAVAEFQME